MKKIISVIGVMLALMLSLTGCMKMDVDLVVDSPEKATLGVVMAFDKSVIGEASIEDVLASVGTTEDQFLASFPENVQRSPFDEGNFKGYEFSLADQSLLNISDTSGQIGQKINIEFRDGEYHFASAPLASGLDAAVSDSTLTVTFPGKVVSASEGAEIDGNTVSFNMLTATGDLTAVAEPKNNTALYLSFGFGALSLIGAVIAVAFMRKPETAQDVHA